MHRNDGRNGAWCYCVKYMVTWTIESAPTLLMTMIDSAVPVVLTGMLNRQTDRHTDCRTYNICNNRPHLFL